MAVSARGAPLVGPARLTQSPLCIGNEKRSATSSICSNIVTTFDKESPARAGLPVSSVIYFD